MADQKSRKILTALKDARRNFRMVQIIQEQISTDLSELTLEMNTLGHKLEVLNATVISKDEILDVYKEYYDEHIEKVGGEDYLTIDDVHKQFKIWASLYFPKTTVNKTTLNSKFKSIMGAPTPLKNGQNGWKGYQYKENENTECTDDGL